MISQRLQAVHQRIEAAERSMDHSIEIVAVTKAFPPSVIRDAAAAGCAAIGENYAQELLTKRDTIESLAPEIRPRVDFIGQLQSNKVRQLVGLVDRWCSVDRASLVDELAKRAPGAEILIQINTVGEAGKGGCAPNDVDTLITRARDSGLSVIGVMTVGPTGKPPAAATEGFMKVREIADERSLSVVSMGMSADLEVAIAAGSTSVRVGSALFGARDAPRVHQEGPGLG